MCGIVGTAGPGFVAEAEVQRMCDAIRHRGPDDWGTFVEGGDRPRHAPPQHHRPGGRPPADHERGRQRARRVQRRDLQPRSAPPRAGGGGTPVPDSLRHRGPRAPLRGRRRTDASSACAGCSRSPSGTGATAGCCSRAITSGRSRCSTPSRAGGSPSPPRSRRCWRTTRASPGCRRSHSTSISRSGSFRRQIPSSRTSARSRLPTTWSGRTAPRGSGATGT